MFGNGDIHMLPLNGEKQPKPFLATPFNENQAAISPDGRWVAYSSNESVNVEVYLRSFPGAMGKSLVSVNRGGILPRWRADGKELYWRDFEGMIYAAKLELRGTESKIERPEALFRVQGEAGLLASFEPSPDGRKFLIQESEGEDRPDLPLAVVQNWAGRLGK